jgi:hypothetical protein
MKKIHEPINYAIDFTEEDLKEFYINKWIWKWVEQFHPEVFTKAREYIDINWKKINVENTEEEPI